MYTLRQKIRLWAIYSRSLILVIQVSRYRTVTQYRKVNGLSRCDKCKTGVGTNGYLGIRLSSFYVIKLFGRKSGKSRFPLSQNSMNRPLKSNKQLFSIVLFVHIFTFSY